MSKPCRNLAGVFCRLLMKCPKTGTHTPDCTEMYFLHIQAQPTAPCRRLPVCSSCQDNESVVALEAVLC